MNAQQIADVLNSLVRLDPLDDGRMKRDAAGDYVDFDELAEAFGLVINYDRDNGPLYTAIPKAEE